MHFTDNINTSITHTHTHTHTHTYIYIWKINKQSKAKKPAVIFNDSDMSMHLENITRLAHLCMTRDATIVANFPELFIHAYQVDKA